MTMNCIEKATRKLNRNVTPKMSAIFPFFKVSAFTPDSFIHMFPKIAGWYHRAPTNMGINAEINITGKFTCIIAD
jgi:hypothetical protein